MWLWYLKCCTEQNQTILTNDFVTKTQKCQSRSITRAQTHHSRSFTKYCNTILNIILWWDFTEAKQWLLGFFVSLPPLCLWHLAEHHAVVWTCLHRFLSWWTTIKRAKRSTKVLLLRQESLLDTGICSHLIKFIMMSRTIELVLYCINNATGLQLGCNMGCVTFLRLHQNTEKSMFCVFFLHVYFNVFHNFITSSSLARVSFSSWL